MNLQSIIMKNALSRDIPAAITPTLDSLLKKRAGFFYSVRRIFLKSC